MTWVATLLRPSCIMSCSPPNMSGSTPTGNFSDIYGVLPSLLPPACWVWDLILSGWRMEGRETETGHEVQWVGVGSKSLTGNFDCDYLSPLALATGLLTGCHGSHPTAHRHPAAALPAISHRDKSFILSQHRSSSSSEPHGFQNRQCLVVIA